MAEEAERTDVLESDPSGDSAAGLAGGMGTSSERVGRVRGSARPTTHGAEPTAADTQEHTGTDQPDEAPPEQSADPATGPEPHPANDLPPHQFDPGTKTLHSHG